MLLNNSIASIAFTAVPDRLGAASTSDVLMFDTDFDSDSDIVFVNRNGVHQVFRNSDAASAIFTPYPVQLTAESALAGTTGSLSADQRTDLALVGEGGIHVFFNDGRGNLGRGDETPPVLRITGPAAVSLVVGETYRDAGATATDETDGDISDRIVTDNPVDSTVIGSYTVRDTVTDLSGNRAPPVTRTVSVQPRDAAGSSGGNGGGGPCGPIELGLLLLAAWRRRSGIAGYSKRRSQQP
jgi:hypothetical protein